jgi:pyruvate/2-oxoglutarate/acetoin dehydrogenase E1 component
VFVAQQLRLQPQMAINAPSGAQHVHLCQSCWVGCPARNWLQVSLTHAVLCCAVQVMRLSSQDVPTAYAYELEAATIVQPNQVVDAVEQMCGRVAATV